MPAPANDDAEVLFADWLDAHPNATADDLAALVEAHPAHAAELNRMFADWGAFAPVLRELVPGSISVSMGATRSGVGDSGREELDGHLEDQLGLDLPDAQRYAFRRVIGQGGGGVVLKVWDGKLHRFLAMKLVLEQKLSPTPVEGARRAASLSRFIDEARIASQLDHPSIVPVHEIGADANGRVFFTMRLVEGDDLARVYARLRAGDDGVTQLGVLQALSRAAEAVAYAHARGVVHRDLKPANIMIGRHGEVHVMDWGLARILPREAREDAGQAGQRSLDTLRANEREQAPDSPLLTGDGAILGTPAYMSPEQAQGDLGRVGLRSDVYAFGAMIYELVTGTPPFVAPGEAVSGREILERVRRGPPRRLAALAPTVPPELAAICERAMAREPNDRYADVRALDEDLRAYLEGRVVRAYETGTWAETRKWVARNRALAAALATVVIVAILGAVGFAIKAEEAERNAAQAGLAQQRAETREETARRESYAAAILGAQAAQRNGEFEAAQMMLKNAPAELRGWEWEFLDASQNVGAQISSALIGPAVVVAASPDGRHVLTGNHGAVRGQRPARIWSVGTGMEVAKVGASVPVPGAHLILESAEFAPDGQSVLVSQTGIPREPSVTTSVYDTESGECQFQIGAADDRDLDARYSSDGGYIASRTESSASIRRSLDGASLFEVEFDERTSALGLSDDSSLLAVALEDGAIHVIPTGASDRDVRCLLGTGRTHDIEFSPDGSLLAATVSHGRREQEVVLWSLAAQVVIAKWDGCSSSVFNQDGDRLLLGGRQARLIELPSMREISRWASAAGQTVHARFDPSGALAVSQHSDGTIEIRDARSGRMLDEFRTTVDAIGFTPSGAALISTGMDRTLRAWSLAEAPQRHQLRDPDGSLAHAWSARWAPTHSLVGFERGEYLGLWDIETGEPLARLPVGDFSVDAFRIDAASGLLSAILGGFESIEWVQWDLYSGRELARSLLPAAVTERDPSFLGLAGGLVLAGIDTALILVDPVSSEIIFEVDLDDPVEDASVSADGRLIAVCDSRGRLSLLRASTGESVRTLMPESQGVLSLHFDPSGSKLVACFRDGDAWLWDLASERAGVRFQSASLSINFACLSDDGRRVFTHAAGEGVSGWSERGRLGVVQIWDSGTGRLLMQVPTEAGAEAELFFDGATRRLYVLSDAGELVLLDGRSREVRLARTAARRARDEAARALFERYLSDAEGRDSLAQMIRAGTAPGDDLERAALRQLMRVVESARGRVRDAKSQCPLAEHAAQALRSSASADHALQSLSLDVLDEWPESAIELAAFVERVLDDSSSPTAGLVDHAVHCAQRALELHPSSERYASLVSEAERRRSEVSPAAVR